MSVSSLYLLPVSISLLSHCRKWFVGQCYHIHCKKRLIVNFCRITVAMLSKGKDLDKKFYLIHEIVLARNICRLFASQNCQVVQFSVALTAVHGLFCKKALSFSEPVICTSLGRKQEEWPVLFAGLGQRFWRHSSSSVGLRFAPFPFREKHYFCEVFVTQTCAVLCLQTL